MIFRPSGATTRRKLLSVLLRNGVSPRHCDAHGLLLPRAGRATPACGDSRALCDSDLSSFGRARILALTSSTARSATLFPRAWPFDVCSWMSWHGRRHDRQPRMTDHGCLPTRSHDLSLVSTGHQENINPSREFGPHKAGELVLTPSSGSPSSSLIGSTSTRSRLQPPASLSQNRFSSHAGLRDLCQRRKHDTKLDTSRVFCNVLHVPLVSVPGLRCQLMKPLHL